MTALRRSIPIAIAALAINTALAQPDSNQAFPIGLGLDHTLIAAAAISPKDDSVWVLPEYSTELWHLDANGRNGRLVSLPVSGSSPKIQHFEHVLAVDAAGDVYLIGTAGAEMPYLVKIGANGRVAFVHEINIQGLHPMGLKRANDATWFVFGDGWSGACVARIKEDGRKIWMRTFPKENLATIFWGAVLLNDGTSILAGNIWDFRRGNIPKEPGSTMLVKLSPTGVTLKERVFPGCNAALARSEDGGIILIDDPLSFADKPGGETSPERSLAEAWAKSRMRMQVWSDDLDLLTSTETIGLTVGFLPPEVVPAPHSGVLVLGGVARSVLARYDVRGKQIWLAPEQRGVGVLVGNSRRFALIRSTLNGATFLGFEEEK